MKPLYLMFDFFGIEFNKIFVQFGLQYSRQACEAPVRILQPEESQELEEIEVKKVEHRVKEEFP